MSDALQHEITTIRQGMVELIDTLLRTADALDLPQAPMTVTPLRTFQAKLQENSYNVLVVGEAKRGKSSFINALIGRSILPTDIDIATSQLFRVTPATQEAYRLRFEDNSTQAITAADLPRFGSQVVQDQQGAPALNRIVRWIEVEMPMRFIPNGVHILDTPGLGGLYAAHAQITHRFVQHADAVLFVLDSSQPIVQRELDFIKQLLAVTPHIFFIQTQIDLHRRSAWNELLTRNETILREQFGKRLTDTRIWPISSLNLLKAAETGDADYLTISRYQPLVEALQTFLFRVAGWQRATETAFLAEQYHSTSHRVLSGRLAVLSETDQAKRQALSEKINERKQRFDQEWGPQGANYRKLITDIQKVVQIGRRSVRDMLGRGGSLEQRHRRRIEALSAVEAARALSATFQEDVVADALTTWQRLCKEAQNQCINLIAPLIEAIGELHFADDMVDVQLELTKTAPSVDSGIYAKLRSGSMDAAISGGLVWGAANLLATIGLLSVAFVPVISFAAGVAAIWGFFRGVNSGQQTQLRQAQQELQKHLAELIQTIQEYFLNTNIDEHRLSKVDHYFDTLESTMIQQIKTIVQQKTEEARVEIEQLKEKERLDTQERQQQAQQIRNQMAQWEQVGRTLDGLTNRLQKLDEQLTKTAQSAAASAGPAETFTGQTAHADNKT